MARFQQLQKKHKKIYNACMDAQKYEESDPKVALQNARQALEMMVRDLGETEGSLKEGLNNLEAKGVLRPPYIKYCHGLRLMGNKATHEGYGTKDDAKKGLYFLSEIAKWYDITESQSNKTNKSGGGVIVGILGAIVMGVAGFFLGQNNQKNKSWWK